MSEDTRNIHQRIEAARQKFGPIMRTETAQVGTRVYGYADLGHVIPAVEPALRDEGVGIFPRTEDGKVITVLCVPDHPEACEVIAELDIPLELNPQQVGSVITYFRRYELVLLLNLVTEADDDAGQASRPAPRPGSKAAKKRAAAGGPADDHVEPEPVEPVVEAPAIELKPGWTTVRSMTDAHNDLTHRIVDLQADLRSPCISFKQEHGWPLTKSDFEELQQIVEVAEGFTPHHPA